MTPALRSAPTRTPRGRCREVPQKRWAISWHRSDKNFSYKKNIGEKAASSPMLFHPFRTFRQVGQGVGQSLTHTLTHNVFDIFVTKKHRKPKFSMLFGAGGVTRTHDLLITKSRKDIKITISGRFQHFLLGNQCSLPLLFPLFPSARFTVWVSVWVKPENLAQKLRRSNQRIAGLKQVHFKL